MHSIARQCWCGVDLNFHFSRMYFKRLISTRVLKSLKNLSLAKTGGYVNGAWINSNHKFPVEDPGLAPRPDAKIADVSSFGPEVFSSAIETADLAFRSFRKTSARQRVTLLHNMYELINENIEDLAKIIVYENGKPLADALGEIKYAASYFQWFGEEAAHYTGSVISLANPSNRILTIRQPIGVCGIITPWNFPSAMIARKAAAAVAAGCTSVIKPALETPLSALALAELLHQAGLPKGVINVLPSHDAAAAGKIICEHPLVKKTTFTGSTKVGKLLMQQSASTMKKCSFELGGNAPFIVFDDADLEKAVEGLVGAKFRSSGQTCICPNRVFVHESVYEDFSERLVKKLASTVLGYGLDDGITHGPVIHGRSLQKVKDHIDDAVNKGAKLLLGGKTQPHLGDNFHQLTVLGDVTSDMQICQEETFGPVCPLIRFSLDEEVIAEANNTTVGLSGYFYTNSIGRIFTAGEEIEVGMIGVNTGAISEAALPFGGVKESGFGREGSHYGIEDYTTIKTLVLGDVRG